MTNSELHPFEKAGLGKAPFRYVGQVAQDILGDDRILSQKDGVTFSTKPGGTCDACGTYIVDMFRIVSSDGQESVVGCDCILKVSQMVQERKKFQDDLKALKKAKAKKAAELKKAKDKARVQAAIEAFDSNTVIQSVLGSQPHPQKTMASWGRTMADYVSWMFLNAGLSGQVQAAKIVEGVL